MISSACATLGERALICAAGTDFSNVADFDHVKVVGVMNYAANLPAAAPSHTTEARAPRTRACAPGCPRDPVDVARSGAWGARVKRLKVGTGRRFSATTEKSLVADLRTVLAPQCLTRARELATRMTKTADSVAIAADLVENFARSSVLAD